MKSSIIKFLLFCLIGILIITSTRVLFIFKEQNIEIHRLETLYKKTHSDYIQIGKSYYTLKDGLDLNSQSREREVSDLKKEVEALNKLLNLERHSRSDKNHKVIYLTFDDGPSHNVTPELLDLLDNYKIKATFFVTGYQVEKHPEILLETYKRGHAIGNHSASHNYYAIYKDLDSFKKDFEKNQTIIKNVIGFEPNLYRFPGGIVTAYNIGGKKNKDLFEAYLWNKNIQYFDWNVDSRDASAVTPSASTIRNNLLRQIEGKNKAIVLMHDTSSKTTTLEALRVVIEDALEKGYRFDILTESGFSVHHKR